MAQNGPATPAAPPAARVLIVDDNKIYRDAFRRNLMLQKFEVAEAEDAESALAAIREAMPDVVITDLQMRTETEGLDLIRQVKSTWPLLPIIMISAVGTFEEGALAQKYGASSVISKSRIEEEIERLYDAVGRARDELARARTQEELVQRARTAASREDGPGDDGPALVAALRAMLADPATNAYLRGEAFDLFNEFGERQLKDEARTQADQAATIAPRDLATLDAILLREMPAYAGFTDDSKESLRIAEYLYGQQEGAPGSIDFSRNVGFSYCFAVENEAKRVMAKRLQKFLGTAGSYLTVAEMMEQNNQHLSIFFHQYLLMLTRGHEMDFTIDNVRQTFRRILEHQSRYKPDGLKALGIMVLCFGRNYTWTKQGRAMTVNNPLALKGLADDNEVLAFADHLISLQHYRNPYIHPEISDMEKLSKIRSTAFSCLNMVGRLS